MGRQTSTPTSLPLRSTLRHPSLHQRLGSQPACQAWLYRGRGSCTSMPPNLTPSLSKPEEELLGVCETCSVVSDSLRPHGL